MPNLQTRMVVAVLAATTIGLAGCGGHSVAGHPVAAPQSAGTSTSPTVAAASPTTALPSPTPAKPSLGPPTLDAAEVERLWESAVDRCSNVNARVTASNSPPDPHNFGLAAAWPTDATMQDWLSDTHPHGTREFTADKMVDLRAAELATRGQVITVATRWSDEVAAGRDPESSVFGANVDLDVVRNGWAAARAYFAESIDTGTAVDPPFRAGETLRQADAVRKAFCH